MRRWPLTRLGIGVLVAGGICLGIAQLYGLTELRYLAIFLFVLVILSMLTLMTSRRRSEVVRTIRPDVATVGDTVSVELRMSSRSFLPTITGDWEDRTDGGVEGDASGTLRPHALRNPNGVRETNRYYLTATKRGERLIGPVRFSLGDPFGISRSRISLGSRDTLLVLPEIVDLAPLPAHFSAGAGTTRHARSGEGADALVARPYAPGDGMRRIHWPATAHRDELMVRQEEPLSISEATIVLERSANRWSRAALSPGMDPSFENAVSACASIAARCLADGYIVRVLDGRGTPLCPPIDKEEGVRTLSHTLATISPTPDDSFADVAGLASGSGPFFALAGRVSTADLRVLAPAGWHATVAALFVGSVDFEESADADEDFFSRWRWVPLRESDRVQDAWNALGAYS